MVKLKNSVPSGLWHVSVLGIKIDVIVRMNFLYPSSKFLFKQSCMFAIVIASGLVCSSMTQLKKHAVAAKWYFLPKILAVLYFKKLCKYLYTGQNENSIDYLVSTNVILSHGRTTIPWNVRLSICRYSGTENEVNLWVLNFWVPWILFFTDWMSFSSFVQCFESKLTCLTFLRDFCKWLFKYFHHSLVTTFKNFTAYFLLININWKLLPYNFWMNQWINEWTWCMYL